MGQLSPIITQKLSKIWLCTVFIIPILGYIHERYIVGGVGDEIYYSNYGPIVTYVNTPGVCAGSPSTIIVGSKTTFILTCSTHGGCKSIS